MPMSKIYICFDRSLQPLYLTLVDQQSTEQLRQNREKLSQDLTELINEYGPKAFSDFDRKSRATYICNMIAVPIY
jgi:hypothetical protein